MAKMIVGMNTMIPVKRLEQMEKFHFRGSHMEFAGNFFRWNSVEDFLNDIVVRNFLNPWFHQLGIEFWERSTRGDINGFSATKTFTFDGNVGWKNNMNIDSCIGIHLTKREDQNSSKCFVRSGQILAPFTNEVTIRVDCRLDRKRGGARILFQEIYPGPNITGLKGNLFEKYGLAFFSRDNEGESLLVIEE